MFVSGDEGRRGGRGMRVLTGDGKEQYVPVVFGVISDGPSIFPGPPMIAEE